MGLIFNLIFKCFRHVSSFTMWFSVLILYATTIQHPRGHRKRRRKQAIKKQTAKTPTTPKYIKNTATYRPCKSPLMVHPKCIQNGKEIRAERFRLDVSETVNVCRFGTCHMTDYNPSTEYSCPVRRQGIHKLGIHTTQPVMLFDKTNGMYVSPNIYAFGLFHTVGYREHDNL